MKNGDDMSRPTNSEIGSEQWLSESRQFREKLKRDIDELVKRSKIETISLAERRKIFLELALPTYEQKRVLWAAQMIKREMYGGLAEVCDGGVPAKFWHAVAGALDVLNGKGGGKDFPLPTPVQENIVKSYLEAFEFAIPPTLAETKKQFKRLFGEHSLPADKTFRETLTGFGYPRGDKRGRPKGSKDSDKRTRRSRRKKVAPK
jgi:hypothetical protein